MTRTRRLSSSAFTVLAMAASLTLGLAPLVHAQDDQRQDDQRRSDARSPDEPSAKRLDRFE